MSGTLSRRISRLSDAGYGVNLFEVAAPSNVVGVATNIVGMVALLPWGPESEVTFITSPGEFWATFYPDAFTTEKDYTSWPAILALLGKVIPGGGIKVCRVAASSAAKATSGDITAGTGTIQVVAKYKGAIGNNISYQFLAATGGDSAKRDLVIAIGSTYTARYKDLSTTTVLEVDDPYVDITASSPSAMPTAGSATALSSGSNGSPVSGDFVGTSSSFKGIRCFYGDGVGVSVLFVAEPPSGVVDAVNAGLVAYAQATDKGLAVLCTVGSQTAADAATYVASYRDDRAVYTWPKVKLTNFLDPNVGVATVDGAAFAAFAIANVDPWISPGGAPGAPFLRGIVALTDDSQTRTGLDTLNDAGVAPWYISRTLGSILRLGRSTALTGKTRIFDRRTTDYIMESIGNFAEQYVETQLDVILSSQTLGPNTGAFVSAVRTFLTNEKNAQHIKGFSIDPFGSNTEVAVDAGTWVVAIAVELYSAAERIVIKAQVGTTVIISES